MQSLIILWHAKIYCFRVYRYSMRRCGFLRCQNFYVVELIRLLLGDHWANSKMCWWNGDDDLCIACHISHSRFSKKSLVSYHFFPFLLGKVCVECMHVHIIVSYSLIQRTKQKWFIHWVSCKSFYNFPLIFQSLLAKCTCSTLCTWILCVCHPLIIKLTTLNLTLLTCLLFLSTLEHLTLI